MAVVTSGPYMQLEEAEPPQKSAKHTHSHRVREVFFKVKTKRVLESKDDIKTLQGSLKIYEETKEELIKILSILTSVLR